MEWGSGSGSRPEVDSKAARQARPTRALLRRPADPPPRPPPPRNLQPAPSRPTLARASARPRAAPRGPPWLRRPPPPPAVRAPFTHQRRGRQSLAHSGAARAASGSGAGPWARCLRGGGCPQLAPGLGPPAGAASPPPPTTLCLQTALARWKVVGWKHCRGAALRAALALTLGPPSPLPHLQPRTQGTFLWAGSVLCYSEANSTHIAALSMS